MNEEKNIYLVLWDSLYQIIYVYDCVVVETKKTYYVKKINKDLIGEPTSYWLTGHTLRKDSANYDTFQWVAALHKSAAIAKAMGLLELWVKHDQAQIIENREVMGRLARQAE